MTIESFKYIDQMSNEIKLDFLPKRIISLVPSQTELLHHLELDEEVVGITTFCIHPEEWHRSKTRVGGTKSIHFDRIEELTPDLIIGNKEENEEHQIKTLMKDYPVWMSDIKNLEDALEMILALGEITGKTDKAISITCEIQNSFEKMIRFSKPKSVIYLIWRNPIMVAGKDTFIDDMLGKCGFVNSVDSVERYPILTAEELSKISPDCIFLSSEPYPFKEENIKELKEVCPQSEIKLVDGEMFSWYGSRLLKAPDYFRSLIV